jgi:vitamin B12 transporter
MRFTGFVLLIICAGILGALSLAQTNSTISGIVRDPNHAFIPRATVRLSANTVELARTLTDQQGRFRFAQTCSAGCSVEIQLSGFQAKRVAVPLVDQEIQLDVARIREEVNVTANRTETPTGQIGSSTSTISADEIVARQSLVVSDLLQVVPGVIVNRSGGLGTITSLFIRGGESDHTKILVDGVPINEPGGAFDFSNLAPDDLERVEIVRGPQSALFGSDAMTGVVQFFTRRGQAEDSKPHLRLNFDAGKYNTFHGGAGVGGQFQKFDYDGYWSRIDTDNQGPDADFSDSTGGANLGLGLGKHTQLRWVIRGDSSHASTPGQTAFGPPDTGDFLSRADGYTSLAVKDHTTSSWDQRLMYTYDRSRQVSRDDIEDPPFTPVFDGHVGQFELFDFIFNFVNDTRRHHIGYQSDLTLGSGGERWGQHILTLAFDWDREQGFIGDPSFPSGATSAERNNFGGTFQHQAVLGRLFLSNGVRVEQNGSFGQALVPRSSAAFLIRQGTHGLGATKLKSNFGMGIKEPNFTESFSPEPSFRGNPNLRPERARSFDFGIEQRFWGDLAKVEVNWFDNRFRDLIQFESLGFDPATQMFLGSFFNVNRTKANGSEVIVEAAPVAGLRLTAAYTYLNSRILESSTPSDPVFGVGQSLQRRPRHSGSLGISWNWRRLTLNSTTLYVGRRVDSDFVSLNPPLTSADPYTRWDLAWTYQITKQLSYLGVIENMLDRSYMEALGFPALRITYRTGLRFRF